MEQKYNGGSFVVYGGGAFSDGFTYHIFTNPNSDNLVVTGSGTKPAAILLIGGGDMVEGIWCIFQHAGGGGAGALYVNPEIMILLQEHIP